MLLTRLVEDVEQEVGIALMSFNLRGGLGGCSWSTIAVNSLSVWAVVMHLYISQEANKLSLTRFRTLTNL